MLVLHTGETVLAEVSQAARTRIAQALRVPLDWVSLTWVPLEGGDHRSIRPQVDVELPPNPPPADMDVNDPVAWAAWEKEVDALPGIGDVLKARGVDQPEKAIAFHVRWVMSELAARMKGLG